MVRNGVWKLLSMEKLINSQRIGLRIKSDRLLRPWVAVTGQRIGLRIESDGLLRPWVAVTGQRNG
jgi:hypothetical protein